MPLPADHLRGMLPWSLAGRPAPDASTWDSLWWDGVSQFLPWRWILSNALSAGELPLWSPWSFCGQPFAANGQSACFYPPTVLLCGSFPVGQAVGLLWLFHLSLAILLTWGLARTMRASHVGGLAAGLVYAGGGFMLAWAPVPSLIQSAAWLPGALWAVEALLHERPWRGVLGLALCLGMAVLAGHMQVAGYVWLTTLGWGAARLTGRALRHKPAPLAPLALGFALGLGLAAVQWAPAAELGQLSPRGSAMPTARGYELAKQLALNPRHLWTLLWPTALGTPGDATHAGPAFAEHFCGLGPLSLALALLALVRSRRRHTYGMLALAAVALAIALATPLAALIYFHLPFLGQTAGFQRVLFVFCLAAAMLAGLGLDSLGDWTDRRLRRGLARPLRLVLLLALTVQGVWMTARLLPLVDARSLARLGSGQPGLAIPARADERLLALTMRADWTLKPRPRAVAPPNTAVLLGLQDVQGYDSLYPRLYREEAARIEDADPAPLTNGNMVLLENATAPELGQLAVRYVLSPWPIGSPLLRKVRQVEPSSGQVGGEALWVYERVDWRPRWRVRGDPRQRAVKAARVGYNAVRLSVAGRGGELVLADTPYPGWRAYVDGRRATWAVDRDLRLLRTVRLPEAEGPHTVDFVFWPVTVVLGCFLSLLATCVLAAVSILLWGRPAAAADR